jgi:peptidoglycan/LPS O-acetylase OafA/YrhL
MILHLKNLTTFRAVAACAVIVSHIERFKFRNEISSWYQTAFFKNTGGHIGVILFFALSGFLITYLLLNEKQQQNTVSIPKFYMRRILRVWPLYFFILFLSYFCLDYPISTTTLVMTLTFIPNIADGMAMRFEPCPPLWSLGVEEQFYLTWPFLIKYSKHLWWIILSIFILITALPFYVLPELVARKCTPEFITMWTSLFENLKFNCMASGALFAVLLHQKPTYIQKLTNLPIIPYLLILTPFYLWFTGVNFTYCTDEIYSVLFSISIILVCTHPKMNIDSKITVFLGTISFGLYLFHWIILEFIFKWNFIPKHSQLLYNTILYSFTFGTTILISYLSYNYYERPFLHWKKKFTVLK